MYIASFWRKVKMWRKNSRNEVTRFTELLKDLELQNMLSDPDDHRDAIVTFNPGCRRNGKPGLG
jgi:hypothetical protein